eukprot:SAG31_NODE_14166_length_824_cov_0.840000_1_plen_158_part_00
MALPATSRRGRAWIESTIITAAVLPPPRPRAASQIRSSFVYTARQYGVTGTWVRARAAELMIQLIYLNFSIWICNWHEVAKFRMRPGQLLVIPIYTAVIGWIQLPSEYNATYDIYLLVTILPIKFLSTGTGTRTIQRCHRRHPAGILNLVCMGLNWI